MPITGDLMYHRIYLGKKLDEKKDEAIDNLLLVLMEGARKEWAKQAFDDFTGGCSDSDWTLDGMKGALDSFHLAGEKLNWKSRDTDRFLLYLFGYMLNVGLMDLTAYYGEDEKEVAIDAKENLTEVVGDDEVMTGDIYVRLRKPQ